MKFLRNKIYLLGIGVCCLVAAVLMIVVIGPYFLRLPDDFSYTAGIVSTDNFYDAAEERYTGEVFSKTQYHYQVAEVTADALEIKHSFSVFAPDDELIFSVDRLYGVDPLTQQHVSTAGDRDREGYLFAPRFLDEQDTFVYWHVNYDTPARMEFASEEEINGLVVYRFTSRYEDQVVDQTQELQFMPMVGDTLGVRLEPYLQLWVEPTSGSLISYQDDTLAYFYDLDTGVYVRPWNRFSNTFTQRSIQQNIAAAKITKTKVLLLLVYLPVVLVISGVLLLFIAFGWLQQFLAYMNTRRWYYVGSASLVLVSFLALLGWLLDIQRLTNIVRHGSSMNPLTAICFLLLGVVIFSPPRRTLTLLFASFILFLAGAQVAYLTGVLPFAPDLLLFKGQVLASTWPARMAQFTSVGFIALSTTVICCRIRLLRVIRFDTMLSVFVFVVSLIALFGFLFDALNITTVSFFFSVGVNTAVLFLIASALIYVRHRPMYIKQLSLRSQVWIGGGLLLFLFLAVAILSTTNTILNNRAQNDFEKITDQAITQIEERIEIYINALQGARGLLLSSVAVSRAEWRQYIDTLEIQKHYPGIQGIGYAVFIDSDRLTDHIAMIQAEGFPQYTVRPVGDRNVYTAIVYLEPFDIRNQQAFGYDMFSNPIRRTAMEVARDTGKPTMSGRITLVQEIDDDVQPGFLIYLPYYGTQHQFQSTVQQRRDSIIGYVYSPFRARSFVEGIFGSEGLEGIAMSINDGLSRADASVLYDDVTKKLTTDQQPRFEKTRMVYVAGRLWEISFSSVPTYGQTAFERFVLLFVQIITILITVLVLVLLHVLVSSRERAINYAQKVTTDLATAKKAIEEKLHETERMNRVMVDRELKMIELKKTIKQLKSVKSNRE